MPDTIDIVEDEVIVTTSKPAPENRTRKQPQYVVIVLNDDEHTFDYVVDVLQRVCGHSLSAADQLAKEIDESGKAVVWSGTLEIAELKRDQIREFGPDNYPVRHKKDPVTFPLGVYVEPLS